jgi:ABC-type multidrug transport system fused ATPase/permease subunit
VVTTLSALGMSLFIGPVFGAISFAYLPLVIVVMLLFGRQVKSASMSRMIAQKKLGGIVEEILSAVKLIVSFAQEKREVNKFLAMAADVRQNAQN